MKQLLMGIAVSALVLSACSSEDDLGPNGGKGSTTTGGGYVAVNIQLPTTPGTRALNDNFDDGTANEYAVQNAALAIFKGGTEKDAKFVGAYDLVDYDGDNGSSTTDNLTATFEMVAKVKPVEDVESNDKLFALALVNYGSAGMTVEDGKLTIGSEEFSADKTFADLLNKTSEQKYYQGESVNASTFFMTNAPMSTEKGGAAGTAGNLKMDNVKTLTEFDVNKIFATPGEAKANPAANIYVERAVAKVTFSFDDSQTSAIDGNNVSVSLEGWTVNNTESSSYIVRNLGTGDYLAFSSNKLTTTPNYRFVGSAEMGTTSLHENNANGPFRTYWCIDPHYNTTLATSAESVNTISDWQTSQNYIFYPHENTFDVANQTYKNSSRVVLKVKISLTNAGDGADTDGTFYVLNGDQKNLYVKTGTVESFFLGKFVESPEFLSIIQTHLNAGKAYKYAPGDVAVTCARDEATGLYKLTGVTFPESGNIKTGETFKTVPASNDFANLFNRLNKKYEFAQFKDGICYYDLRLMHFASTTPGNDLAPWTNTTGAMTVSEAYGDPVSGNDYLGRYGMVRNNWYDVQVTKLISFGHPAVPDAYVDTPDDNKDIDKYLAFKINILSWAKRTNQYEL